MNDSITHQLSGIKVFPWKYHITWMQSEAEGPEIYSDKYQEINDLLDKLCRENKVSLLDTEIRGGEIDLSLGSEKQLNLGKMVKNLQKQISKQLGLELADWKCQMVTAGEEKAKYDVRIKSILDNLWSGSYYDLDEGLSDAELKKLKSYLENRKLAMIEMEEQVFLADREALAKEINLNCFACTKKHQYGCCCGSPCGFSEKNMDLFDRHTLAMEEALQAISRQQYERLQSNGGFMTANGKLKAYDGHCSLLIEEQGIYKCLAHKYALDHQIAPYEICPLSCLMYPLEMIELVTNKRKKVILLTSVIEEDFAQSFGRWGSYESLEVELRCIHKEAHNDMFKKEDYRPVYEVNQGLLSHEFGKRLYKSLKKLI